MISECHYSQKQYAHHILHLSKERNDLFVVVATSHLESVNSFEGQDDDYVFCHLALKKIEQDLRTADKRVQVCHCIECVHENGHTVEKFINSLLYRLGDGSLFNSSDSCCHERLKWYDVILNFLNCVT